MRHVSATFGALKRIAREWSDDNAIRWSASLAFYALLSLAPLLVVTVSIGGLVYGKKVAEGQLAFALRELAGPNLSPVIQILLASARKPVTGWIAAVFGTVTLFLGASAVVTEMRAALNAVWHVPSNRNVMSWADLLWFAKQRAYASLVILGLGLLLLISLVFNTWLGAVPEFFGWRTLGWGPLAPLAAFLISFLVITFVFAAVFKLLPSVWLTWRDVVLGGAVTALLFIIGKQLIALYVSRANLGSVYGAAGAPFVALIWVYYSAQVFFFGAEFTKVYAETFGARGRARAAAAQVGGR